MNNEDRQLISGLTAAVTRQTDATEQHVTTLNDLVQRHDRILHGNGHSGLVSRVYLLMWILGFTSSTVVAVVVFLAGVAAAYWR